MTSTTPVNGSNIPVVPKGAGAQKLDETVLSRFWSSLNQPLKPAIQCWTTIPLYPSTTRPIQRVREREVRFFDLDKLNRLRQ